MAAKELAWLGGVEGGLSVEPTLQTLSYQYTACQAVFLNSPSRLLRHFACSGRWSDQGGEGTSLGMFCRWSGLKSQE